MPRSRSALLLAAATAAVSLVAGTTPAGADGHTPYLVFNSDNEEGLSHVRRSAADNTDPTQVTAHYRGHFPVALPTGGFAYVNELAAVLVRESGDPRVVLPSRTARERVPLAASRDTGHVLVAENDLEQGTAGLVAAPLDGGEPRVLTQGRAAVLGAAISPDDSWVAYSVVDSSERGLTVAIEAVPLLPAGRPLAGGRPVRLLTTTVAGDEQPDHLLVPESLAWSPDGSRLAFVDVDYGARGVSSHLNQLEIATRKVVRGLVTSPERLVSVTYVSDTAAVVGAVNPVTQVGHLDRYTLPGGAGTRLLSSLEFLEQVSASGVDRSYTGDTTAPGGVQDLAASVVVNGTSAVVHLGFGAPGSDDVADYTVRQDDAVRSLSLAPGASHPVSAGTSSTWSVRARDWNDNAPPWQSLQVDVPEVLRPTGTARVLAGGVARVTGALRSGGAPLAGAPVELVSQPVGRGAAVVARGTTAPDGTFTLAHRPSATTTYTARSVAPGRVVVGLPVRTTVTPVLTGALTASQVRRGKAVRLNGVERPAHAGQYVHLQRQTATGGWRSIGKVRQSASGAFSLGVPTGTRGTFRYRSFVPAHADHAAASGPRRTLKVT